MSKLCRTARVDESGGRLGGPQGRSNKFSLGENRLNWEFGKAQTLRTIGEERKGGRTQDVEKKLGCMNKIRV